jgi:hypothetical protein
MASHGYKRNPDGVGATIDRSLIRFESSGKGGFSEKLRDRVPEIRKLLHLDMTLVQIAATMGVTGNTLRKFIKKRSLCDLKQRRFMRSHGAR